jgi:hypothetical protein
VADDPSPAVQRYGHAGALRGHGASSGQPMSKRTLDSVLFVDSSGVHVMCPPAAAMPRDSALLLPSRPVWRFPCGTGLCWLALSCEPAVLQWQAPLLRAELLRLVVGSEEACWASAMPAAVSVALVSSWQMRAAWQLCGSMRCELRGAFAHGACHQQPALRRPATRHVHAHTPHMRTHTHAHTHARRRSKASTCAARPTAR